MGKKSKITPFEKHESPTAEDKFIRLPRTQITSEAWYALQHGSRTVFIEMKRRYQGSNKEFSCPYSSMSKLISKGGFLDAIDDLVAHGFIRVEFNGWAARKCSIYSFSEQWYKWPAINIDPTKTRRPIHAKRAKTCP